MVVLLKIHVDPLDLGAHLAAKLGVEVRERLVEEKALGIAHDGAADRDALPLPARQRLRLAIEHLVDAQNLGGLLDLLRDDVASAPSGA